MMFQEEYNFTLPRGYVDENGQTHRDGIMRLATAADEILPLRDPRVAQNPGYLHLMILARVITKLGTVEAISEKVIERLYTHDMSFLQDFYNRINQMDAPCYEGECPVCGKMVQIPINYLQERR